MAEPQKTPLGFNKWENDDDTIMPEQFTADNVLADELLAQLDEDKAEKSETYTKSGVDQLLAKKVDETSLVSGGHVSALNSLPTGTYVADNNVEGMPLSGSWWFVTNIRYSSDISMLEVTSTSDVSVCYRASWVNGQWSGWRQVAFV